MEINKQSTEVSNFISKLLRDHFGKGPEAVYVSIGFTFITVYIRNFLSPTERVLLKQDKVKTILELRDSVMESLIPEIKAYIKFITGMELEEFYYDWGIHNKSAMFLGISSDHSSSNQPVNEDYNGKSDIETQINKISEDAQKIPDEIYSCKLNDRTLIVVRNGILIRIEKELIREGFQGELRNVKRSLEKGFLHNNIYFDKMLETKVLDIFVDWDFDLDKSIIVFITNPTK